MHSEQKYDKPFFECLCGAPGCRGKPPGDVSLAESSGSGSGSRGRKSETQQARERKAAIESAQTITAHQLSLLQPVQYRSRGQQRQLELLQSRERAAPAAAPAAKSAVAASGSTPMDQSS